MYQVWLKYLDIYSSYRPETKLSACIGKITPSKFFEIRPLAIPNQISTISMHIPILVKIHWCLLSYHPETKYGRTYDGRTDRQTDVQRETIIPRHYRVAEYNQKISSICRLLVLPIAWQVLLLISTRYYSLVGGMFYPVFYLGIIIVGVYSLWIFLHIFHRNVDNHSSWTMNLLAT